MKKKIVTRHQAAHAELTARPPPAVASTAHAAHGSCHGRPLARARARSLAPLIGSATACAAAARAGAVGGVAAAPRVARASAVRHRPPRPPRLRASPRLAYRRRRAAARAADAARRGPALASRKRLGAARALHSTSLTPREVSMSTALRTSCGPRLMMIDVVLTYWSMAPTTLPPGWPGSAPGALRTCVRHACGPCVRPTQHRIGALPKKTARNPRTLG